MFLFTNISCTGPVFVLDACHAVGCVLAVYCVNLETPISQGPSAGSGTEYGIFLSAATSPYVDQPKTVWQQLI